MKDGASQVAPQVGITQECPDERKDVDSSCPLADIVCCFSIILLKNPCKEENKVHANSKERKSRKTIIHCISDNN